MVNVLVKLNISSVCVYLTNSGFCDCKANWVIYSLTLRYWDRRPCWWHIVEVWAFCNNYVSLRRVATLSYIWPKVVCSYTITKKQVVAPSLLAFTACISPSWVVIRSHHTFVFVAVRTGSSYSTDIILFAIRGPAIVISGTSASSFHNFRAYVATWFIIWSIILKLECTYRNYILSSI